MGNDPAGVVATTTSCGACKPAKPIWTNRAANQDVHARCLVRPKTLEELREVIREVSARKGRMKAVATGLSFSDILQTDDTLVVLTDLLAETQPTGLLPLEDDLFHAGVPYTPRVRVIAGARIRELNAALARAGLAFTNLGGYDGQTLLGAISTSTHGSGRGLGPLPDAVVSLDLVTTDGVIYRIEPSVGVTDPLKFAARYGATRTLVQKDEWFYSVLVSLGTMGVIYSAVISVRPAYQLLEQRRLEPWSDVKHNMIARSACFRHFEVFVNPYRRRDNGEHMCLVTERSLAPAHQKTILRPKSSVSAERLVFRPTTQQGVIDLSNATPRMIPFLLQQGLEALVTPASGHCEESFRIFNVGLINDAKVLSDEYFVPLENAAKAIDTLIGVIGDNARHGIFQTGPLSCRFIKTSAAYLSMIHGNDRMSIEIALFIDGRGTLDALDSYEQALYALGSRPHWGQIHRLSGARGWADAAYSKMGIWRSVQKTLNHKGVFNNAFTDRLHIS